MFINLVAMKIISEVWTRNKFVNVFLRNFCKLFRYYLYSLVDWMLSGVVGLVWLLVALDPLTTPRIFSPTYILHAI